MLPYGEDLQCTLVQGIPLGTLVQPQGLHRLNVEGLMPWHCSRKAGKSRMTPLLAREMISNWFNVDLCFCRMPCWRAQPCSTLRLLLADALEEYPKFGSLLSARNPISGKTEVNRQSWHGSSNLRCNDGCLQAQCKRCERCLFWRCLQMLYNLWNTPSILWVEI